MRQEMSKTHEKGPKKVDKNQYEELMEKHAQQHAKSIQGTDVQEDSTFVPWRKGDIEAQAAKEAQKETMYAAQTIIPIEEKKISKHAKRRANKKKKIVVSGGVPGQEDEYAPGEEETGDQQ